MNLSDELRDIAIGTYARGDLVRLAADIIDSLPRAKDGSPIWKGCWAVTTWGKVVHVVSLDSIGCGVLSCSLDERTPPAYAEYEIHKTSFVSSHRTSEEAKAAVAAMRCNESESAAAKRAGGEE